MRMLLEPPHSQYRPTTGVERKKRHDAATTLPKTDIIVIETDELQGCLKTQDMILSIDTASVVVAAVENLICIRDA